MLRAPLMRMRCKDFFCWGGGSLLLLGITSSDPPLHLFFKKRRGVNFNYLRQRGNLKNLKGLEAWCMGTVFLKGCGGRDLVLFLFNCLKVYCLFFSATIILWKKVILSCLNMNLKISHKLE